MEASEYRIYCRINYVSYTYPSLYFPAEKTNDSSDDRQLRRNDGNIKKKLCHRKQILVIDVGRSGAEGEFVPYFQNGG